MAGFTGLSSGTLYTATQGASISTPLVIENIRYVSGTGGAGKTAKIYERSGSGAVFFQGRVSASYGLAPATYHDGKLVRGIIVKSLPEGYLEIDLK